MNKKPALIAAFLTTTVVALAMLMIGLSAYINPDSVPISTSPAAAVAAAPGDGNVALVSASTTNDQVQQLQALVAQYQSREQQYQSQLNDATAQVQQYQQLLNQLQQAGVIQIDRNGQVSTPRRRRGD
jgi:hypothetical protein